DTKKTQPICSQCLMPRKTRTNPEMMSIIPSAYVSTRAPTKGLVTSVTPNAMYKAPSRICHRDPVHFLFQNAVTTSNAPAAIDNQPINMVLTTVKNATSPNIRNPATSITSPSRTRPQDGREDGSLAYWLRPSSEI